MAESPIVNLKNASGLVLAIREVADMLVDKSGIQGALLPRVKKWVCDVFGEMSPEWTVFELHDKPSAGGIARDSASVSSESHALRHAATLASSSNPLGMPRIVVVVPPTGSAQTGSVVPFIDQVVEHVQAFESRASILAALDKLALGLARAEQQPADWVTVGLRSTSARANAEVEAKCLFSKSKPESSGLTQELLRDGYRCSTFASASPWAPK